MHAFLHDPSVLVMVANDAAGEGVNLQRAQMNLIEFPIGIVSERVPLDPSTGKEAMELLMQRTITDGGQVREQKWVVVGHPKYGGHGQLRPPLEGHSAVNGAFAFLVATAFDQVAHQERAAARQVAADAELLLGWLRARPAAPTLKELAQRAPLLLRDKSRRSRALAWLLRKGRARRERRGKATVLVAT